MLNLSDGAFSDRPTDVHKLID